MTPAFYPHDIFRSFGARTKATPDGRNDSDYLSRGNSPSEFVEVKSITDILNSLKAFDLFLFPESFVTELTLPYTNSKEESAKVLPSIIENFLKAGGSSLQINILDKETLIKAKAEPAKYKFLVVRICGYSQSFNSLTEEKKNEVIRRAVRAV